MPTKKASEQSDQGGFNPRPAKAAPHKQVGPMPTSGNGDRATKAVTKKIKEKEKQKERRLPLC